LASGPVLRGQTYTYKSRIDHPIVRYKMAARFDPTTKTIKGRYTLSWWNHTEDRVADLYFHLYLNAFKNADSTFMQEQAVRRRHEELEEWFGRPGEEKWGWVEVDKIQIVGGADLTGAKTFVHPDDENASDQTVLRIALPEPVPPHGTIDLAVDFTSKLPRAAARNGFEGDYFLMAQWFPKIGVYEGPGERGRKQGGWNCHQYHANTEFYADYGVYDVELNVPSNFVVGATGIRRSETHNPDRTTTYNYYQEDVHDFAWTSSPRFVPVTRTFDWRKEAGNDFGKWAKVLGLSDDQMALRDVSVTFLLEPGHLNVADRYFRALFNGLKYFGLWYGQYPYDTLTVVDVPRNSATCCMEYPTFITVGTSFWPGERSSEPEGVTVHEFGHQFWYGLVGNNEFEEAWLDEGFNTYSTGKVLETAYGPPCGYQRLFGAPVPLAPWLDVELPRFPFAGMGSIPMGAYFSCDEFSERTAGRKYYLDHAKDDDLVRNGWQYLDGSSYTVNSYTRVGLTLRTLESTLGPEVMARAMRAFHQRWRFRHPATTDFINVVNQVSGQNLDWFFQQFFYASNRTDYAVAAISSDPMEAKIGFYDEGGKKVFHSEKAAAEASRKSKQRRYHSTVLVKRLGEALAPVDVEILFENGETVHEHWDGKYRWIKYVYEKPSKVKSAEVDPERKLALEANFTNNSRTAQEDNRGAARWYVQWIFWVENLFFAAGFFS
jgi:hypothetical protein